MDSSAIRLGLALCCMLVLPVCGVPQPAHPSAQDAGAPSEAKQAPSLPSGTVAGDREPVLIKHVQPARPAPAAKAKVTGVVPVEAVVGKDGHVKSATAVRGSPLLRQAAVDAVMQWTYTPAWRNGSPVETGILVAVSFLQDAPVPGPALPGSDWSSGGPRSIHRVPPVYPPELHRISGTVRIEATVGLDGRMVKAKAISGPTPLRQLAVDAVSQKVCEPAMRGGVPVEFPVNVEIGFRRH